MKITTKYLQRIIKEELNRVLKEKRWTEREIGDWRARGGTYTPPDALATRRSASRDPDRINPERSDPRLSAFAAPGGKLANRDPGARWTPPPKRWDDYNYHEAYANKRYLPHHPQELAWDPDDIGAVLDRSLAGEMTTGHRSEEEGINKDFAAVVKDLDKAYSSPKIEEFIDDWLQAEDEVEKDIVADDFVDPLADALVSASGSPAAMKAWEVIKGLKQVHSDMKQEAEKIRTSDRAPQGRGPTWGDLRMILKAVEGLETVINKASGDRGDADLSPRSSAWSGRARKDTPRSMREPIRVTPHDPYLRVNK